jgi:spore coat polysaccharide biosynthesis predicted glycosyltransferase SpsG
MPEIMTKCDVGITSRGRTGYELALLGIPSIAMAQNRREEKHGFVCAENGFTYLGLHPSLWSIESTLDVYLNMPQDDRQRYQDILLSHDLRNGRKRVTSLINSLM